jgi:hypothetical protein
MWRACEWPRLILPVAVTRKRFAAPLCVFSFGIIAPFQISDLKFQTQRSHPDRCHPGCFSPEDAGTSGVAGVAGATGATGRSGVAEDSVGAAGAAGDAGATGAAGAAGAAGAKGVPGAGLF